MSMAFGPGASADYYGVAIGANTHANEGQVVIHDAILDLCTGCGNIYSPNVSDVAEEIRTDIYKMDPLGALAEIPDHEG